MRMKSGAGGREIGSSGEERVEKEGNLRELDTTRIKSLRNVKKRLEMRKILEQVIATEHLSKMILVKLLRKKK